MEIRLTIFHHYRHQYARHARAHGKKAICAFKRVPTTVIRLKSPCFDSHFAFTGILFCVIFGKEKDFSASIFNLSALIFTVHWYVYDMTYTCPFIMDFTLNKLSDQDQHARLSTSKIISSNHLVH